MKAFQCEIVHGNNCHADIVVSGGDQNLALVLEAQTAFEEAGFEIVEEAVLGHFAVWGSRHAEGAAAQLTEPEVESLETFGTLIAA